MDKQDSVFRQAGIRQDTGLQHFDAKKFAGQSPAKTSVKEFIKISPAVSILDDGRKNKWRGNADLYLILLFS